MKLIKDENPMWDDNKKTIVEEGPFNLKNPEIGSPLEEEWWKLIDMDQNVLGYGWITMENNDFEISVAIHKNHQELGLGTYILGELEQIAKNRGFKATVSVVRKKNDNSESIINWLCRKNYISHWLGIKGMEPKSKEFAINVVKKSDITLIKNLE
ncbi:GNAT family N-acetyltransferase [Chungangia koreensis]